MQRAHSVCTSGQPPETTPPSLGTAASQRCTASLLCLGFNAPMQRCTVGLQCFGFLRHSYSSWVQEEEGKEVGVNMLGS